MPTTFNIAKPWHSVFKAAIADKLWWDENLHRPAMLYLTRVKSASESIADGRAQQQGTVTQQARQDRGTCPVLHR